MFDTDGNGKIDSNDFTNHQLFEKGVKNDRRPPRKNGNGGNVFWTLAIILFVVLSSLFPTLGLLLLVIIIIAWQFG